MSSSEDEEEFTTKPLQDLLENLYDDLTDAAISAKRIYKEAKSPTNLFTHSFKVKKDVRDRLQTKYISMEELLDLWLPLWQKEGRLSANGYWVRIPKDHGELLGFPEESEHDIYTVANHMTRLFEQ